MIGFYLLIVMYTVTVRKKIDTLRETRERHTANNDCEMFLTIHLQTVADCVPTKPRSTYRVPFETTTKNKKQIT